MYWGSAPYFGESVAEAASEDVSNKTVNITSDTSKRIVGGWAGTPSTDTSNAIYGGFTRGDSRYKL